MARTISTFVAIWAATVLLTGQTASADSERFLQIERNGDGLLFYSERRRESERRGVPHLRGWIILNDGRAHGSRVRYHDDVGRRTWRRDDDDDDGYRGRRPHRDDDDD